GGVALGALGGGWLIQYAGFPWIVYTAIFLPIMAWIIAHTLEGQNKVTIKLSDIPSMVRPKAIKNNLTIGYSAITHPKLG
ncbi:MAG: hypothetical protein O7C59_00640, partial [Rickettsia endosymbiont of Ixodes persulcatus]|nr:hypothetical protein [Rickettsia endosymbiont of Ixodes persulcatus]